MDVRVIVLHEAKFECLTFLSNHTNSSAEKIDEVITPDCSCEIFCIHSINKEFRANEMA